MSYEAARPTKDPGQGVEPRSPRSERGVLPVRRSRNGSALRSPSQVAKADAVAAPVRSSYGTSVQRANDVVQATRLTFDPGSPNCGVLRGGPLEPGALAVSNNSQAKAAAYFAASFPVRVAQRNLSLLGGASQLVVASQAEHHLSREWDWSRNDEGDPVGSPSQRLLCG